MPNPTERSLPLLSQLEASVPQLIVLSVVSADDKVRFSEIRDHSLHSVNINFYVTFQSSKVLVPGDLFNGVKVCPVAV